ncbi:hypothetical protein FBY40_1113 [Microbacterium sp. SLBN-154]|nr:hypothetical protein FBY40_1113 [Microbacterium sp. SLBN-154]
MRVFKGSPRADDNRGLAAFVVFLFIAGWIIFTQGPSW